MYFGVFFYKHLNDYVYLPLQLIFEVHLLKTSERTVAHEIFFTIRGIKALSSVLVTSLFCKEMASWQAQ